MSHLSSLQEVLVDTAPDGWSVSGSQLQNMTALLFEWRDENEDFAGDLTIDVFPYGLYFLGLRMFEPNNNLFRSLCRVLPSWARAEGISNFVVPIAESDHMQQLLEQAGFVNLTGTREWRADVSKKGCPVEVYGQSK